MTDKEIINYDELKVALSNLSAISALALSVDDRNSTYATLTIVNMMLEQLVDRLEERRTNDPRT
ncbi:hypothetical protein [Streptococcus halotolerans]|uniref:hypothetical protein n=1 Tax=Streptococcus halotolerans TaxID=1814128 RepID=UPI00078717CE|nr:hypothetical protein [Streptococcus halotolerans]